MRMRAVGKLSLIYLAVASILTQRADVQHDPAPTGEQGFLYYGVTTPAFREGLESAYKELPPETRAYLKSKGVAVAIGPTRTSVDETSNEQIDKISSDVNETRTHSNQASGAYISHKKFAVATQYQHTLTRAYVVGSYPSAQTLASGEWTEVPVAEAQGTLRHEVGHAVDFNTGFPSHSYGFKQAVDLDMAAMEGALVVIEGGAHSYMIRPHDVVSGYQEVFAETWAGIHGGSNNGQTIAKKFPNAGAWVSRFQQEFIAAVATQNVEEFLRSRENLSLNEMQQRQDAATARLARSKDAALLGLLSEHSNRVEQLNIPHAARALAKMTAAEYAAKAAEGDAFNNFYATKFQKANGEILGNAAGEILGNAAQGAFRIWVKEMAAAIAGYAAHNYKEELASYNRSIFEKEVLNANQMLGYNQLTAYGKYTPALADWYVALMAALSSDDMAVYGLKGQKDKVRVGPLAESAAAIAADGGDPTDKVREIREILAKYDNTLSLDMTLRRAADALPGLLSDLAKEQPKRQAALLVAIQKGIDVTGDARLRAATKKLVELIASGRLRQFAAQDGTRFDTTLARRVEAVVDAFPSWELVTSPAEMNFDLSNNSLKKLGDTLAQYKPALPTALSHELTVAVDEFVKATAGFTGGLTITAYNNFIVDKDIHDLREALEQRGSSRGLLDAHDAIVAHLSTETARENSAVRQKEFQNLQSLVSAGYWSYSHTDMESRLNGDLREAMEKPGIGEASERKALLNVLARAVRTDYAQNRATYLNARLEGNLLAVRLAYIDPAFKAAATPLMRVDSLLAAAATSGNADMVELRLRVVFGAGLVKFGLSKLDGDNKDDVNTQRLARAKDVEAVRSGMAEMRDAVATRSPPQVRDVLVARMAEFEKGLWRGLRQTHPDFAPFIDAAMGGNASEQEVTVSHRPAALRGAVHSPTAIPK